MQMAPWQIANLAMPHLALQPLDKFDGPFANLDDVARYTGNKSDPVDGSSLYPHYIEMQ